YAALMYHELERAGRPLARTERGYVRYVLGEAVFGQQLAEIARLGLHVCSVGDALGNANTPAQRLVLTFDDGCESDLLMAAPLLAQHGCRATFYIVSGFLGQRG